MKDIKIKKLALENFKCHKSLTLELNGRNASVYGDNAAGKTSIYDALTWLLFGKDSKGNGEKNIEIKPLNENGEIRDHLAETAVEAVLLVDGEEITLRRTLKEIWTTKRGHSEQTYDGNTSEYYIDGVPVKKYTFSDKVNELVSEDTFRMLTSVSHFADGITWQDRRAVLFKVAAVAPDEAIMVTDERFAPLAMSMGKLSVEDYKKKLTAEKRGLVTDKTEIPARISECQKTIEDVQNLDFDKAQVELANLTAKR
ncbi:MAG: AAA family ATPase, partial [Ruminococcus sp.]|nr:AAA family ATPase [Ruminococcus sp.]